MEIERSRLGDALRRIRISVTAIPLDSRKIRHLPVDLIGRRVNNGRANSRFSHPLEHVQCPEGVNLKVGPWINDGCCHSYLSRQMQDPIDVLMAAEKVFNTAHIPHIQFDEFEWAL